MLDEVAKVVVVDSAVLGAEGSGPTPLIGVATGAEDQPAGQVATVGLANDGQLINLQALGGPGQPDNAIVGDVQNGLGSSLGEVVATVNGSGLGDVLNQVNDQLGGATQDLLGGTGGLLNVNVGGVNLLGGSSTGALGINLLSNAEATGSTASVGLLSSGQLLNLQGLDGAGGVAGGQLSEALAPLTGTLGDALAPLGETLGGVTGQVGGLVDNLTSPGAPLAPVTPVADQLVGAVGGLLTGDVAGGSGGVLAPVTGLVDGLTGGLGGGTGGVLAPVTGVVDSLTGGLAGGGSGGAGGVLAPVTGVVDGLTGGLTGGGSAGGLLAPVTGLLGG